MAKDCISTSPTSQSVHTVDLAWPELCLRLGLRDGEISTESTTRWSSPSGGRDISESSVCYQIIIIGGSGWSRCRKGRTVHRCTRSGHVGLEGILSGLQPRNAVWVQVS